MPATEIDLENIVAIDVHTHVQASVEAGRGFPEDLPEAAVAEVFGSDALLTVPELAAFYRERKMAAVCFMVDSVRWGGPVTNEEILELSKSERDVLLPFVSVDPHRGAAGVKEARRLIEEHDVRGFKFHPTLQHFFPDDPLAYPLYALIAEYKLPAVFHTGQTAVGSGQPSGGGMLLKYSNPIHLDQVAADFPDMTIIMAHPSVPWQDEALSVDSVVAAIGSVSVPWTALRLRALQGREAEAAAAIASAIEQAATGAHTLAIYAHWAAAVLYNGLARYEEAAASARQSRPLNPFEYWVSVWALPELVEAAARVQDTASARDALERLAETTQPSANDSALGIEARCRALLSQGATAERLYQDAIERLGRARATPGARARSPAVRGVAAARAPPPGRPRTAADGAPDVHGHWHGGVRRACPG